MCFLRTVHAAAISWTDVILSCKTLGMWQQDTGREEEPTEAGHRGDMCPLFRKLLRGDWWDVDAGWESSEAHNSRFYYQ